MATFIITGLKEIDAKIRQLEPKLSKKVITKAMRDAAKDVSAVVKTDTPVGETGELKKAVKVKAAKRSRTGFGMLVIIDNPHAAAVEYGTSKQKGNGFMRKAYDATANHTRDKLVVAILAGLEQIIKES